jgi:hypothetical protein
MAEYLAGRLLIVDTNDSVISYIDLNDKDLQLHTLELKGLEPPSEKPKSLKRLRRRLLVYVQIIKVDAGKAKEVPLSNLQYPMVFSSLRLAISFCFCFYHLKPLISVSYDSRYELYDTVRVLPAMMRTVMLYRMISESSESVQYGSAIRVSNNTTIQR